MGSPSYITAIHPILVVYEANLMFGVSFLRYTNLSLVPRSIKVAAILNWCLLSPDSLALGYNSPMWSSGKVQHVVAVVHTMMQCSLVLPFSLVYIDRR